MITFSTAVSTCLTVNRCHTALAQSQLLASQKLMMSSSGDTLELSDQEHKKYYLVGHVQGNGPDFVDETKYLEILKIIPSNDKAKLAFNNIIGSKDQGELNGHYCQYLIKTGQAPLSGVVALQSGSDDDGELADQANNNTISYGHFEISLKSKTASRVARWAVGKGLTSISKSKSSERVEILLTLIPSKYS